MAVDSYQLAIPASGQILMPNPANFFFLLNVSSGAVTSLFQSKAAREQFQGLSAGLRVQRLKSWDSLVITGIAGTVVTFFYGTETPREDSTDYVQTIATISGSVTVTPGLGFPNTPTDHADVTVTAGSVDTTITANALRRSVSIGSLSTNAPATSNLRVQGSPGAATTKGVELQPGTYINLPTTAALAVYNPDANSQKYWWQEYT